MFPCVFIHIIQILITANSSFSIFLTGHFPLDTPSQTLDMQNFFLSTSFDVTNLYFDRQGNLSDKHFSPAKLILICIWQA